MRLTEEEFDRLNHEFGDDLIDKAIKVVDDYCERSVKTYKNYNLVIRDWGLKRAKEERQKDRGVFDVVDSWYAREVEKDEQTGIFSPG